MEISTGSGTLQLMQIFSQVRAWAARHTEQGRYSPVGQGFHWLMAALVVFQLWWGWRMGRLPPGADKLDGYAVHSQIGLALLVIIALRGIWRLAIPGPETAADGPSVLSTAAHLTHYAFYALLVALPVSGWVMWSAMAFEYPLLLAGVAPWPLFPMEGLRPEERWNIMRWSVWIHQGLIWTLIALIGLHAGAALKHHFIDRDGVLASIVPFLRPLVTRPEAGRRSARER